MKFLRLVLRNATRNRRRAILAILSVAVAIVTISVLQTILDAFSAGVEMADENRLVTREATAIIYQLPLAYRERIRSIPGVREVSYGNWFGGNYQDRKNFFAKFAVDAGTYFPMYPELGVPPGQYKDFLADRKGCVIGKKLAERFGFKVGDTVPIEGDIYAGTWEFNVRAIYEAAKPGADETMMLFHWKYLDESLPLRRQGQAGWYIVQLEDSSRASAVAKNIDSYFENSADQTLTETEKAFAMDFVKMMGNVGFLLRSIAAAVVFAIVLVAANTMAMAARERTMEIAVLKAIGFPSGLVARLVVAEGALLTLLGGAVGIALAWLVCRGAASSFSQFFPVFALEAKTAALALGIAAAVGLVSGLFPAWRAARLSVVQAMREVA